MPLKYAYVLPIIEGLWFPVTFAITYTIGVLKKDIPAVFPYVSDTGAWSIEKCIFSFMLGLGSLLMFSIIYIRYRQVKELLSTKEKELNLPPKLKIFNVIAVYLGLIAALGVFVVACFQVWPHFYVHIIGAGTAFTVGWFVLVIETYISFKIYPTFGSSGMNTVRAVLTVISGLALFLTGAFGGLSLLYFKGEDVTQWFEDSGGYEYHLVSTVSEWVLVLGVVFYIASYYKEFKDIVMYKPKIDLINV
ncbi:DNA damage-regulated autophagy modulator protein 2-like [Sitophilus oryzae]|uniref:DNA damage-regulated autophagy modulator protein 2-like n=1 Tax=Sitophilus oryzae TaxID=7048 RepID=A0A6J2XVH2_SITOR|nr:DNA damage-regulated autophagy modulator protein 2-like [Sitophilus oryzae]